jgi:hypothetical protein
MIGSQSLTEADGLWKSSLVETGDLGQFSLLPPASVVYVFLRGLHAYAFDAMVGELFIIAKAG